MPRMQEMSVQLNSVFGAGIGDLDPDLFGPDSGSLAEAFARLPGVQIGPAEAAYIDAWPTALQAALKAALHENLRRDGTVPVTFAWTPGYDYDLRIWDVRDSSTTRGGMTVLVTSRYPDDPHPLGGTTTSS